MEVGSKILVIDDDPDIREAVTMILGSKGYQVTAARDAVEGLGRLKAEKPSMIILDLMMPDSITPGMGGFTVYKSLKDPKHAEWNDIPILVLTGLREDFTRKQCEVETGMALAVDDYVDKPISSRVLLDKVEELLTQRGKSGT